MLSDDESKRVFEAFFEDEENEYLYEQIWSCLGDYEIVIPEKPAQLMRECSETTPADAFLEIADQCLGAHKDFLELARRYKIYVSATAAARELPECSKAEER